MTDFPSYSFKSQAFKYLMPEKPLSCGASPYRLLQRIQPSPPVVQVTFSQTLLLRLGCYVAARKLAYKSKDWKGFVALLLSKHMDEMLNSVLKMYWFTFSHKYRLFKRKTTTVTFTQKPKVRATGLLSLKRKRKGSVSLQSKVRYLFCYSIWLLSQYRDHQKSHERFA